MKELLVHLWKSSRAFQIAVVVSALAVGSGFLGRSAPPPASPPDPTVSIPVIGGVPLPGGTAVTDSVKSLGTASSPGASMILTAATDIAKKSVGTARKLGNLADDTVTKLNDGAPVVVENSVDAAKTGARVLKKGAGAFEQLTDALWDKVTPKPDPKSPPQKP